MAGKKTMKVKLVRSVHGRLEKLPEAFVAEAKDFPARHVAEYELHPLRDGQGDTDMRRG